MVTVEARPSRPEKVLLAPGRIGTVAVEHDLQAGALGDGLKTLLVVFIEARSRKSYPGLLTGAGKKIC
jgi:hypothetical protein